MMGLPEKAREGFPPGRGLLLSCVPWFRDRKGTVGSWSLPNGLRGGCRTSSRLSKDNHAVLLVLASFPY